MRERAAAAEPAVRLWPENRAAFAVYVRLPWREGPFGGRLGLDWAQAEAVVRWMGREPRTPARRRRLFEDLRACEAGALRAWEEAARRARDDGGG